MFIFECGLDVVNRCIRHAATIKDVQPFFRGFHFSLLFDHVFKYIAIFDA